MKYVKLYIYFFLLLAMRVNSTKNGPSPIFEFKAKMKPINPISVLTGLYQATSEDYNNKTVYKKLESDMYIYVNELGDWAVSDQVSPNAQIMLSTSRSNGGETTEEPPTSGWKYFKHAKWNDDETVRWERFDCCEEIKLTSSAKNSMGKYKSERLGKYRETELIKAGRFVYQQVDGSNVLYYAEKEGWRISEKVGGSIAIKYESSSSCPVGKPSSNPYWKYSWGSYSSFSEDRMAMAKCWIRNVSDVICLTEHPTRVNNVEVCKFPFIFEEKVYDSCITDNKDPSKAWCSTGEETEDGAYKYDDSKWGYCQQNCTIEQAISSGSETNSKLPLLPIVLGCTTLVFLIGIVTVVACYIKQTNNYTMDFEMNEMTPAGEENQNVREENHYSRVQDYYPPEDESDVEDNRVSTAASYDEEEGNNYVPPSSDEDVDTDGYGYGYGYD